MSKEVLDGIVEELSKSYYMNILSRHNPFHADLIGKSGQGFFGVIIDLPSGKVKFIVWDDYGGLRQVHSIIKNRLPLAEIEVIRKDIKM